VLKKENYGKENKWRKEKQESLYIHLKYLLNL
jgi:hypothetical protein